MKRQQTRQERRRNPSTEEIEAGFSEWSLMVLRQGEWIACDDECPNSPEDCSGCALWVEVVDRVVSGPIDLGYRGVPGLRFG